MTEESRDQPARRVHVQLIANEDGTGSIRIDAREIGRGILTISDEDLSFFRLTGYQVGWKAAVRLVVLGAALQKATLAHDAKLPKEAARLTPEDKAELGIVCQELHRTVNFLERDRVLEMAYDLLQEGSVNREQAAKLASVALGKEIKESAWRKAVDKWAREHGKPKLDLSHGRPSKKPEL